MDPKKAKQSLIRSHLHVPPKKHTFKGKFKWHNQNPKPGELHTKTFEGEEWYYCLHHGYWCQHKSRDIKWKSDAVSKELTPTNQSNEITDAMAKVGIEEIAINQE